MFSAKAILSLQQIRCTQKVSDLIFPDKTNAARAKSFKVGSNAPFPLHAGNFLHY